jgi:hypothetical protein
MRFSRFSFMPMKSIPMKAIRLTMVTEARIAISSFMAFCVRNSLFIGISVISSLSV